MLSISDLPNAPHNNNTQKPSTWVQYSNLVNKMVHFLFKNLMNYGYFIFKTQLSSSFTGPLHDTNKIFWVNIFPVV